ncbi:MAG: hypothetical protein JJT95_14605 [Pararhodobacter sp.]|nr:hypothetical protein [Pararhodobacter sp.]
MSDAHSLLLDRPMAHGRAQFDEVALMAGIRPKRTREIVEQVDAGVAGWDRHAQRTEVPQNLSLQIAEGMNMARGW